MIKIIAILSMLLDHIGQVFFPNIDLFTIIGRLALPLFAWEIAMGFRRTKNVKLYAVRLFAIAVLSQYPHDLLFNSDYLNICFTLLAGLLILQLYKAKISYFIKIPAILFIGDISHMLNFEYGIYGIALIAVFYLFDDKFYLIFIQSGITIMGIFIYNYYPVQFVSVASVLLIWGLKKYDFKINKIINYAFYPAHIIILLLLLTYVFPR